MKLTLGQAAKQARKSKGTISKALKDGKLSGERQPDGSWSIDPAELQRWQEATRPRSQLGIEITTPDEPAETPDIELAKLRVEVELLRDERDDLRRRLDAESEDRRRLSERLLTAPQKAREGPWWRFW
jgi:hypothetical protein